MNDRHPSGVPNPDDPGSGFSYGTYDADHGPSAYGAYNENAYQAGSHDGYSTGSYDVSGATYADGSYAPYSSYGDDDPLFGNLPGAPGTDTGSYPAPTGSWDTNTAWGTGSYSPEAMATPGFPAQAGPEQTYADSPMAGFGHGLPTADDGTGQWNFGVQETGGWDTTSWGTGAWEAAGPETGGWTTDGHGTAYGYETAEGYAGYEQPGYGGQDSQAAGHDAPHSPSGYAAYEGHEGYDSYSGAEAAYGPESAYGQDGAYGAEAAQFGTDHGYAPIDQAQAQAPAQAQDATAQWDFSGLAQHEHEPAYESAYESPYGSPYEYAYEPEHGFDAAASDFPASAARNDASGEAGDEAGDDVPDGHDDPSAPVTLGTVGGPHGRGRRRSPKARPRRRALMTVAVPSVAVMGVAGAAAASVMGDDGDKDSATVAAPDAAPVKPSSANNKLDSQLQGLSADADDFADRASRTQERIDLKQRQQAEKERKAKEAARKEAMRPKFVIPVKDHTLSARYGQAGVNWMSIHTGIDFPVSYGTPVMAATDGTVSTKHDVSYGNMAVVTAKDGTETWYCHLSSNKIRSGEVKAGDVIAYSGNSGNSTGPHLHFEVHPGGGSAVDPIPWLQSKGLNIS
ncbi:M23 family metallopeptidase [Streptomyces oryzae]|uniref:M23 family metallopeptidase n=1 Tax=Streptomyces oryzae TaxID=1434886 RepID=UPI0027DD256D|nr:peptidoglycan DD-metalloendopeptidase family protein [Streptomyces oryzae]